MDLLDWVGTLLRRWWLTLPLLLAALAGAAAFAVVTPWTYQAKATAVLLASPVQAKQAGGNPWLVFDSSLTVTAEVLGREMMDQRTAAALRAKGLTATYVVGVAPDSTGPVLAIDVSGTDAAGTEATLKELLAQVPQRLAKLQAQESVAPNAQIKMNVISASPKAGLVATDKIRTVVMVLFLGIVVAVAVPLFAEVIAERRRRGRAGPRPPHGAPGPDAPDSGETGAAGDARDPADAENAGGSPERTTSGPTPDPASGPAPDPASDAASGSSAGTGADSASRPSTPRRRRLPGTKPGGTGGTRPPDTPETYGLLTYEPPERPGAASAGSNGTAPRADEPSGASEPDA